MKKSKQNLPQKTFEQAVQEILDDPNARPFIKAYARWWAEMDANEDALEEGPIIVDQGEPDGAA